MVLDRCDDGAIQIITDQCGGLLPAPMNLIRRSGIHTVYSDGVPHSELFMIFVFGDYGFDVLQHVQDQPLKP